MFASHDEFHNMYEQAANDLWNKAGSYPDTSYARFVITRCYEQVVLAAELYAAAMGWH